MKSEYLDMRFWHQCVLKILGDPICNKVWDPLALLWNNVLGQKLEGHSLFLLLSLFKSKFDLISLNSDSQSVIHGFSMMTDFSGTFLGFSSESSQVQGIFPRPGQIQILVPPTGPAAPESPGNLLEMQIILMSWIHM